MNLRNIEHKKIQESDNAEQYSATDPIRKKLNNKLGKNQAVIFYNDKVFKFTKKLTRANYCVGCFFNGKKKCPRSYEVNFPCQDMVLELVKIKG